MKNCTLLIVTLFLIFSNESFGDDNSQQNSFNAYINSSGSPSESPVDTKIPPPIQAKNQKPKEDSHKTDTDSGLQGIPAKWKTCAVDSDCTSAVADCVSWDSLNKKYLKKLSKNLNTCSETIDPGFQPVAVCIDKECKTTEKTTDVSWEDWLSKMR